ncbi:MAG TPA: hypothetical protein VHD33_03690 [Legionellaceae bacterium]|nr:hypothetical protein [Legionellaceae bacterium]
MKPRVTWEKFKLKLLHLKPELIGSDPSDFNTRSGKFTVRFTCPIDGKEWETNRLAHIWLHGRKSCGCINRSNSIINNASGLTFGEAKAKLKLLDLEFFGIERADSELVLETAKVGKYLFKCNKCLEVFGQKALPYKVFANIARCPCVKRANLAKRGLARRGKVTPAMIKAGEARRGRKISESHYKNLCDSAKGRNSITYEDLMVPLRLYGCYVADKFDGVIGSMEQIRCICKCGREFTSRSLDIKRGMARSCDCLKSMPEIEIYEFVKELIPDAIKNCNTQIKYYDGNRRQLDIFCPSQKLAIEHDGLKWHGEVALKKTNRHKLSSYHKYLICKENGINLLTIFEDEWRDKKETVKALIRAKLGLIPRIGARKCNIVSGGNEFVEENHLQGDIIGEHISLVYNGAIIATAVFVKETGQKANYQDGVYNLTRYCLGPKFVVVGGLNKLIKFFWKTHPDAKKLITYSDNRISSGNLYINSGFSLSKESKPSYFYVINNTRIHRFNYRKDELRRRGWLNEGESEWACMQRIGHDRVWDCGKTKWELIPSLDIIVQ